MVSVGRAVSVGQITSGCSVLLRSCVLRECAFAGCVSRNSSSSLPRGGKDGGNEPAAEQAGGSVEENCHVPEDVFLRPATLPTMLESELKVSLPKAEVKKSQLQ